MRLKFTPIVKFEYRHSQPFSSLLSRLTFEAITLRQQPQSVLLFVSTDSPSIFSFLSILVILVRKARQSFLSVNRYCSLPIYFSFNTMGPLGLPHIKIIIDDGLQISLKLLFFCLNDGCALG